MWNECRNSKSKFDCELRTLSDFPFFFFPSISMMFALSNRFMVFISVHTISCQFKLIYRYSTVFTVYCQHSTVKQHTNKNGHISMCMPVCLSVFPLYLLHSGHIAVWVFFRSFFFWFESIVNGAIANSISKEKKNANSRNDSILATCRLSTRFIETEIQKREKKWKCK